MIRIAIVDDEEYYLQKERQITEDYFAGKGVECKVAVYQSAEWFVAGIQRKPLMYIYWIWRCRR